MNFVFPYTDSILTLSPFTCFNLLLTCYMELDGQASQNKTIIKLHTNKSILFLQRRT